MTMKQKDAVYQAITNTFEITDGQAVVLDKEQRAEIVNILCEGFTAKKISYDGDVPVDAELRTYCNGLLSNWLRKDPRLNGNVKYVAKNPGSRSGSTDPQVSAMRILLGTKTDPTERAEIQAFIDRRLAEIKPSAAKTLTPEQVEALKAAGLEHLIG
jgi:hypothetical protein